VAADLRAVAGRLDLPALVISGGDSQLYGAAAGLWLADAIAGAERLTIPGAGHSPQIERPGAFNDALAAFAARLPAAQAVTAVSS
jgi:pimeloyl-ACP methyl ester carboxylesterase